MEQWNSPENDNNESGFCMVTTPSGGNLITIEFLPNGERTTIAYVKAMVCSKWEITESQSYQLVEKVDQKVWEEWKTVPYDAQLPYTFVLTSCKGGHDQQKEEEVKKNSPFTTWDLVEKLSKTKLVPLEIEEPEEEEKEPEGFTSNYGDYGQF